ETSFFAIMAAGATLVIVSGGIDLSVGSTYALVAVLTSMLLRANHLEGPAAIVVGLIFALALGSFAGWLNGLMVSRL
ncbi:ribose ABC transporter permease, partial [Acinetobacter baumannii]